MYRALDLGYMPVYIYDPIKPFDSDSIGLDFVCARLSLDVTHNWLRNDGLECGFQRA